MGCQPWQGTDVGLSLKVRRFQSEGRGVATVARVVPSPSMSAGKILQYAGGPFFCSCVQFLPMLVGEFATKSVQRQHAKH